MHAKRRNLQNQYGNRSFDWKKKVSKAIWGSKWNRSTQYSSFLPLSMFWGILEMILEQVEIYKLQKFAVLTTKNLHTSCWFCCKRQQKTSFTMSQRKPLNARWSVNTCAFHGRWPIDARYSMKISWTTEGSH